MYYTLFAFLAASFFFIAPSIVQAQTPTCTIIYGGGKVECEATASATTNPTATPRPKADQPQTETSPNTKPQTKGGLPVYESPDATKTPDTGPEALALIGLIPAAATGIFLRRKSK